jgi:hypothetical protein
MYNLSPYPTGARVRPERRDLESMLATLSAYDGLFGPTHPQTLHLRTEVGIALAGLGEVEFAIRILDRSARDIVDTLGREHQFRTRALTALRDLWIVRKDYANAAATQAELTQVTIVKFGTDHPDSLAANSMLAEIRALMLNEFDQGRRKKYGPQAVYG